MRLSQKKLDQCEGDQTTEESLQGNVIIDNQVWKSVKGAPKDHMQEI